MSVYQSAHGKPRSAPARTSLSSNPRAMAALLLTPLFFSDESGAWRALRWRPSRPGTLAFWRWFFAVAILLPFAAAAMVRHRVVLREQWKQLIILGWPRSP